MREALAVFIALCASLSLAVPAWAAPDFGSASIAPVVFATSPGSSCTTQPPNSVTLPAATSTGTISYAIANLPPGVTFAPSTRTLTGAPATITAQDATTYTYIATDSADNQTASLPFTLEVVDERAILQTLYDETDGDNWSATSGGWANPITATCLEGLGGVTLANGRVAKLEFYGSNLGGSLPTELGKLTNLTDLDLAYNQLTGSLPTTWGTTTHPLPKLQKLRLGENQLRGSLPASLGQLPKLTHLELYKNLLSSAIPATWGTSTHPFAELDTLSLYENGLTGTVPDLSQLSKLTELRLEDNQLTGVLSAVLAKLPTTLSYLRLDGNQFTGTIPDFSDFTELVYLHLGDNQFTGTIPAGLGNLAKLQTLYLNDNQLSGTIPTTWGTSTHPFSTITGREGLQSLYLQNNTLTDSIPEALGLFKNLGALRLDHNQLSGEIPATLPTNLTDLHLHNNQLSGAIPNLSALTRLRQLHLHNNQLSGAIPNLSALTRLRQLHLHNNQLAGAIPDTLPTSLTDLRLHNNKLSGALTHLGRLTSLNWLSLYDNPRGSASALYGYPAQMNSRSRLSLIVPNTLPRYTMCLYGDADGAAGTTACTIPTKVDQLRLWETNPGVNPGVTGVVFKRPAPAPSGYEVQYRPSSATAWSSSVHGDESHSRSWDPDLAFLVLGLAPGRSYDVRVRTTDSPRTPWLQTSITLSQDTPPRTGTDTGGTGTGGTGTGGTGTGGTGTGGTGTGGTGGTGTGGGGGGGTRTPADRHGNTPEEATTLNPRRYTTGALSRRLDARLQSRRDIDYFQIAIPAAGVLTAATTGRLDTTGRLYQAQEEGPPRLIAGDTARGPFEVGVAVEPGRYYLAVAAGTSFGDYRLAVDYTPAFVDNPAPNSPQSGLSVLSGWVCAADAVVIEMETALGDIHTFEAATGTSRRDTAVACGPDTTDTGYGLLFNWNLLGDGEHTVRAVIDDVVLAERQITVTTLGPHPAQEFRRGLTAMTTLPDFPAVGETTALRWEEALQNFVIASGDRGSEGEQMSPEQARLENPAPGSFQSGLGVISGWVCEADTVTLEIETAAGTTSTEEAGYGTERLDTADVCGDTDNGYGLLFNWNLLGDGQHTVRAYADGEAFAHSTFTVTTLGEEFVENLARAHEIEDFPAEGQTTTVEWQQGQQNFVVTAVE